jgi:predicted N-acyltransferase
LNWRIAAFLPCIALPYESQAQVQAQGMMLRRAAALAQRGLCRFRRLLASMRRDKRKKIKQERRKVSDAGITFEHIRGELITPEQWEFFVRCYAHTHVQYNSPQPLNLAFFQRIGASMPQHILLIIALRDGSPSPARSTLQPRHPVRRSWGAR